MSNGLNKVSTKFLCGMLLGCFSLIIAQSTIAWNYKEHRQLGRTAFRQACEVLEQQYHDRLDEPLSSLSNQDREKYLVQLEKLQQIACRDSGGRAESYGVRTSLSGDHVSKPEDFEDFSAEEQALSWTVYGKLALDNVDHFAPYSKSIWRDNHIKAIGLAIEASRYYKEGSRLQAQRLFSHSLNYASYGDHFLQDTFAIGHCGFSRVHTLQNPSLIFHDLWNKYGRRFAGIQLDDAVDYLKQSHSVGSNKNYVAWYACGDGYLDSYSNSHNNNGRADYCDNQSNKDRLLQTNTYSVAAVILAFIRGEDVGYSMLVEKGFPIRTQSFEMNMKKKESREDEVEVEEIAKGEAGDEPLAMDKRFTQFVGDSLGVSMSKDYYITKAAESTAGNTLTQYAIDDENYWLPMDMIHEKVYSTLSVLATYSTQTTDHPNLSGLHVAYSLGRLTQKIPNNFRVYGLLSFQAISDITGPDNRYHELGLNIGLPNFYRGTPFSHEIELAWAEEKLIDISVKREAGGYVGLNTNIDLLKVKMVLAVGGFYPHKEFSSVEPQVKFMIGYSFGVVGGGRLKRWQ